MKAKEWFITTQTTFGTVGPLLHDNQTNDETEIIMFTKMKEMIWTQLIDRSWPCDPPNLYSFTVITSFLLHGVEYQ